ncbi:myosin phosphatase Rho-interacting protein isoform X2 [Parasteatoda tepidariorum]|uniref:myosin phosphatase Rho-interacting protein isoform X2 n=1 Tax=Parasteatoda tepidariorum TaxID=114398 RepID=UPI001C718C1F|nr:protein outspread isoform X2 [Parasteatoda tepidariorum]
MSGLKSECRKFSPNVFNKTKCQNCFRIKDSHSAEALESNRASRNVSKCGYLFVAPDWDFNVSVNRTKRWQRRWFVLYDDGELTYALDQFPDTIPQGTIDMNKVLDVSDAEGITGNEFAISITTPDKVHFVKGTSKEESKWWFDVLCKVSPRYISRQKHKRNATFPCGKATIPTPAVINQEYCSEDDMRLNTFSRPKFLSTSEMMQDWIPATNTEEDDVFSSKDPYINGSNSNNKIKRDVEVHNALNKLISLPEDTLDDTEKLPINEAFEEKAPKDYLSELEESENRRRNRRYLKRENRIQRNQRSRNDGVAKMIPNKSASKSTLTDSTSSICNQTPNTSAIAAAEKLEYLESIHSKDDKSPSIQRDIIKEIASSTELSAAKNGKQTRSKTNLRKSESLKNIPMETESEIKDHVSGLRRYHSFKGSSSHRRIKSPSSGTSSLKRIKSSSTGHPKATSTPLSMKSSVTLSTSPSTSTNIPSSLDTSCEKTKEGTFMRTGWLMRQTLTKDWSRHWFVLKDSSLTYYRDPTAEHSGIMDGILDLNQVSTIREQDSDKFYAISLRMWDGKKHILAAETAEFRNMWIQALQYAANLWSSASKEDFICTEIVLPEHSFHYNDRMERISSPSSLISLPHAEEINQEQEYSSYSSDDQSEYFSLVDEDEVSDLSSSPRTLPPSPPINRNVISLVKEKSRTRGICGSKSNSLPNSSTDTTYDDDSYNKSAENQDIGHKANEQLDTHTKEIVVEFLEDQLLLNGEERPVSPITPPVEFMNGSDNESPLQKKALASNQIKNKECRNSSARKNQISNLDSKEKLLGECSMCLIMRSKLITAQEEIRKLEKELKEAHANFDNLEMFSYKLTQDIKLKEDSYSSQIALMTAKIDDLTSKFTFAEKNYRQLKQKAAKSETKERRRSSLKNRDGLSLTKEYETKLCELEKKMNSFETSFKREPFDEEGSEISFSDCNSRLNESFVATSESSETNTPSETTPSEGRGFFSRLQTLMSKVDNVNTLFSTKDDSEQILESPKILLQVKSSDELSSLDESDEWHTQSPTDTHVISKTSDQNTYFPKNLSECQNMLSQKLNSHLEWLKNSLTALCENKNNITDSHTDKLSLVNNLVSELNELPQEIESNLLSEQKSLLLFEITKALEKINRTDSLETLLKLNATKSTYKTIFQTFCIAFAEYGNNELPVTLISGIPQFDYFCPTIAKLFPETFRDTISADDLTQRLQSVSDKLENHVASINRAKLLKYEHLWNILTEVPVQDDHIKKPPEINSMFNYITSIATDIHRIAEIQLCQVPKELSNSTLECEDEQQLRDVFVNTLKNNLTNFLKEVKEKCPMVNESTISFYKLKESTRISIIRLIAELSFLDICHTMLSFLAEYYLKIDQNNQELYQSDLYRQDRLLPLFANGMPCEIFGDTFCCPQCTILNNLLYKSNEQIQWLDFVRKYNYYNFRKFDKCSTSNNEEGSINFCANCDSNNFPNSQAKSQKDVCNNVTCTQCDSWIQKFCTSEKQHELEQRTLELKHNSELKQLEECIIKSSEIHEQEMLQKQNELLAATTQFQRLKADYEEQKRMLKKFYEEKLNFECENIEDECIKETYRSEIEDLKDMFKQGLIAIENSHNRITSEMQKRHNEELALLEAEKEKALEIEAQATLTALEAIKKSHAQQLSEETALIREELVCRFQKEENENVYSKYSDELEKLKTEILKITELYSSKCLENVALEEKVNSLRQQLKEAHNELCSLISKNREINISLCEEVEA